MTSAYSAFANQGVRMAPYCGDLDHRSRGQPARGASARAARGDPRRHGVRHDEPAARRRPARHGAAAATLDWPLAGKTGTMDEYTDAWFIGFDPNITVGVWVGYDEKKPLGTARQASAALPIWIEFMRAYIDKRATARRRLSSRRRATSCS